MGSVGTPVVRRMIQVARAKESTDELLASVGLSPEPEGPGWTGESVDEEAYYDLIERIVGIDDHSFPARYGDALRTDDMGALGFALKTAPSVREALSRLVRYVLVLSDTLEYGLVDRPWGQVFALNGRPHHRRGAAVANECALAAVTSTLRQVSGERLVPREVTFRHDAPPVVAAHREYFGCPVTFGASIDGLQPRAPRAGASDVARGRRTVDLPPRSARRPASASIGAHVDQRRPWRGGRRAPRWPTEQVTDRATSRHE